jgi:hypothetical protein
MPISKSAAMLLTGLLLAESSIAVAEVDKESVFLNARIPASELDLNLSNIQKGWWQGYVSSPDAETKKKHPLITKAGVGIQLDYFGHDRITATGWVSNLNGFLELTSQERKRLVLDVLELVKANLFMAAVLVDKKTDRTTGRALENRHIKLTVIINAVSENEKKENIRLFLPSDMGVGQAGYRDGQLVFSEPYYLNLRIRNGVAVPGDPTTFVIERE